MYEEVTYRTEVIVSLLCSSKVKEVMQGVQVDKIGQEELKRI